MIFLSFDLVSKFWPLQVALLRVLIQCGALLSPHNFLDILIEFGCYCCMRLHLSPDNFQNILFSDVELPFPLASQLNG